MNALHALSHAKWIWLREETDNQYASFTCTFQASAGEGTLYISADSDYAAFVNGELAGFNQYDDYPENKAYDTLIVPLRAGENVLVVHAWHQGVGSYQYLPGPAGVIFALAQQEKLLTASDEHTLCRPYCQYQMGEIEVISGQLGPCFHYDASRADAPWEKSRIVTARKDTALYPRPNEKVVLKAPVASRLVKVGCYTPVPGETAGDYMMQSPLDTDGPGRYMVYDLGREEAGLLTLSVCGKQGDKLYIGWGEHLEMGRVLTTIGARHFATTYTLRAGENTFTHYFRRLGGRYLQVMTESNAQIRMMTVRPTEYPVENVSRFTCEDAVLQRIYDTSVRTLHLCMHEHYEDTPWREQALYAMDSRNQALCGYCCFGEKRFPAAYLHLFREGMRPDRLFDICAPAHDRITIPSFSLSWVLACRDHFLWTGDRENAEKLYPAVQQVVDGFLNRMDGESGLCIMENKAEYWNFYEWTDGMDDHSVFSVKKGDLRATVVEAALNLYLILALEAAGQMADWLGVPHAYQSPLKALRESVRRHFYDAQEQAFVTRLHEKKHFSEFNQSLALLAQVLDEEAAAKLRKRLSQADNGFVPISLSCTLMKYEALLQEKQYGQTVLASVREKWGRMLDAGATSFWEVEEGWSAYGNAGSLCHGWSAVPVYILSRLGLGVTPTAPGFASYTHDDQPLFKASGYVPSARGMIHVQDGRVVP